jgi:hypothetical protein
MSHNNDFQDKQLIFIICQPRSGSTLLQHILGGHSQVHALPEPWLMLHLVYGLRSTGLEAEYNARYAYLALKGFLGRIPGGEGTYVEAVRNMAFTLYESALESSGKRYFLDKTPRYYFIIPELYRLFPGAKFIFLLRNPLAVLSSTDDYVSGNLKRLFVTDRKHDMLTAPRLICEGIQQLGERAAVVHYEKLVMEPEKTVKNLCEKIGLAFEPDMLTYGGKVQFEGTTFVDPKSIYKHESPVQDYMDEWTRRLDNVQKAQIAKAYLATLGEDLVNRLGYSYNDLISKIDSLHTSNKRSGAPSNLPMMLSEEPPWWDRLRSAFSDSIKNRGILGTLGRCTSFVLRGR